MAHHDDLYFRRADPIIPDEAYDSLRRELTELEARYPDLAAEGGPAAMAATNGITGGTDRKARHAAAMRTLHKSAGTDGIAAFHESVLEVTGDPEPHYTVEPKYDGVAISLVYEKGLFARGVTRGDGLVGEDVTEQVLQVSGLPLSLNGTEAAPFPRMAPDSVELRGELYIPRDHFQRMNREQLLADGEPFTTARNLTAGSLHLDDPQAVAARGLHLVVFDWGQWDPKDTRPETYTGFIELLRAWRFAVPEPIKPAHGLAELVAVAAEMLVKRDELPFDTDGMVVKLDDVAGRELLGSSQTAPNWALACKYEPLELHTRLIEVIFQVGRTGILHPVARFEPVLADNRVISRASLYNWAYVEELDLRFGDTVQIAIQANLIPAITGVSLTDRPPGAQEILFPETCPSCHGKLTGYPEMPSGRCLGKSCPAQTCRQLEFYAGSVGIRGLGASTARKLLSSGRVAGIPDLYRIQAEDPILHALMGKSTIRELVASVGASREADQWRILCGLGFPQVGAVTARKLVAHTGGLENLAKGSIEGEDMERQDEGIRRLVEGILADPAQRQLLSDMAAVLRGP